MGASAKLIGTAGAASAKHYSSMYRPMAAKGQLITQQANGAAVERTTNMAAGCGELRATQTASMAMETHVQDECGLHHSSKATQLKLSQKVVDHTYRLFGNQLVFAKDVPTHTITSSESL